VVGFSFFGSGYLTQGLNTLGQLFPDFWSVEHCKVVLSEQGTPTRTAKKT